MNRTAFAIGAHPDDIEFMMSGTLILLGEAGYALHYMSLGSGSCGSTIYTPEETERVRECEGRKAAECLDAVFYPGLVRDIDILYEKGILARLGAIMRQVNPGILLVPSPEDYMEDHMMTCRLAVTAAFCMGMKNFPTDPRTEAVQSNCTIYHAMPGGLRDGLRRLIWPGQYVNVTSVIRRKREMLACHRSQKEWLDNSQGMDSYLATMEDMSREVGGMSKKFHHAEGWRRHSHLGFSSVESDPLSTALGKNCLIDEKYEKGLENKGGS